MLVLVVWIAVAVVVLVVLGSAAYAVVGSMQRLQREVVALDRDLRPVIAQVQQTAARAAERQASERSAEHDDPGRTG